MDLPMTEAQAQANARPGERSRGFTCADREALLETLGEQLDESFTRLHVEKMPHGGLFCVLYRLTG